jgi:hypothetical protein
MKTKSPLRLDAGQLAKLKRLKKQSRTTDKMSVKDKHSLATLKRVHDARKQYEQEKLAVNHRLK